MKRAAISLATLAFALAMALPVQAQTDFSGTWKLNAEKSEMGGGGRGGGRGGGMMAEMVVKQTATDLSVTRGEQTVVYKLDGSEVTIAGGRGNSQAKAHVEGATIVIETSRMMNDQTMTTKATWALVDGNLVVTNSSPRGETKMVYEKQ